MANPNPLEMIDWQEALRLAGHSRALAIELTTRMITSLPGEMTILKTLYNAQNIPGLIQHVHKVRGGLAYTGLSRLKALTATLETDLKNNIMGSLASLISQLDNEVCLLNEQITHRPAAMADELDKLASSNSNNNEVPIE